MIQPPVNHDVVESNVLIDSKGTKFCVADTLENAIEIKRAINERIHVKKITVVGTGKIPPLAPGSFYLVNEWATFPRLFIACVKRCEWLDEARARFEKLGQKSQAAISAKEECLRNAELWRRWGKGDEYISGNRD